MKLDGDSDSRHEGCQLLIMLGLGLFFLACFSCVALGTGAIQIGF